MRKNQRTSKLAVTRETIQTLSSTQLRDVAAGFVDSAPADGCSSTKRVLLTGAAK